MPDRQVRQATTIRCPECHNYVPTRGGCFAGHYQPLMKKALCSMSSQPVQVKP
jgi:hypothetical protein